MVVRTSTDCLSSMLPPTCTCRISHMDDLPCSNQNRIQRHFNMFTHAESLRYITIPLHPKCQRRCCCIVPRQAGFRCSVLQSSAEAREKRYERYPYPRSEQVIQSVSSWFFRSFAWFRGGFIFLLQFVSRITRRISCRNPLPCFPRDDQTEVPKLHFIHAARGRTLARGAPGEVRNGVGGECCGA